ncbi:MAG: hypothetical protein ACR2G6_17810 [Gemmatimonadaceae bacterium]
MSEITAETVQTIWTITLGVFVAVLIVVAILLTLILLTARNITAGVSAIWNVGQRIANNTIHIALLRKTNIVAGRILGSAVGVVHATAAVQSHAEECPMCPTCVIGPEWQR